MKQFFKFFFASVFGTVVAFFLFLAILAGIVGLIASSGDDEGDVSIKDNSILFMNFEDEMGDRSSNDPFENFDFSSFSTTPKLGLNDLLKNLKKAQKDERIKGIFLDLTVVNVGFSRMNEIRNAMKEFRASGKFIYTYGDVLDQNAYYLATAGDKIYLNPGGLMELSGLSSQRMFFKGSLEKLEIDIQVIRHGKFKSAVEPFIRENMSEANRLQTEVFINGLWNNMVKEMAESRNIQGDQIQHYANNLSVTSPESAVDLGLIDGVKYRDEVLNELRSLTETDEDDDLAFVKMVKYTRAKVNSEKEKSLSDYKTKIAVIFASGDIMLGESQDGSMGSQTIAKAIEDARKNENVKAVVLRVNSPGGSSLASDIIWREVELTKAVKPVIVSMGNLAASGGYYISCGADKIIADENTITGSIGVFGLIPNAKGMLNNKLGITIDTVNTNTYSDMGSPFRAMKPKEVVYVTELVERIYDDFVNKVSEGRSMSYAEVDSIGQGRVWTGSDALKLGLVDEIGGLERAIAVAAEMSELEDYSILELPEEKDALENLFKDFSDNMESKMAKKYFGAEYSKVNALYKSISEGGIFMRMPFDLSIN
jgi:protease-4